MCLIAYIFPKLQTAKYGFMHISKESCFSAPQDSQHVKESETQLYLARQLFHQLCYSLWENLSWKKSFLVISEILRPFFNTITPDQKYFHSNGENLQKLIEMKLSNKLKIFSQSLTAFPKSTFNFKHFGKKDESLCLCFSEIIDYKIHAYVNV